MKPARSARRSALALLGVFVALLVALPGIQRAASKPAVAAPVLTATPLPLAATTSATFAFTGPTAATFRCSLDGAAFTSCASPVTYTGLAQGGHTFAVKAVVSGTGSAETAYGWVVDTVAPAAPAITGPAGTSGVATPTFAFTGESGASFRCAVDGADLAACTSPRTLTGLGQGSHTFRVVAVDAAGNVSTVTTRSWVLDTVAPPAPVITQKPTDPTGNATNVFAWTTAEAGVSHQCSLENGPWFTCTSPYSWLIDTTNNQQHQFLVRSVDAAGNPSAGTYYSFKYVKPAAGEPFVISGSVTGLTPGLWRPIAVTVTNPNTATIYVTALTVTLPVESTPAGCTTSVHLELEQSNLSATTRLVVPPGGSVTLPAQGVSAPALRIRNLPVNQDVCKGKTFALTYSGTANN